VRKEQAGDASDDEWIYEAQQNSGDDGEKN
jgi:hypothetical protein